MSKATLRIGVSGHQQIGDEATIEFVSQQLRELLVLYPSLRVGKENRKKGKKES